MQNTGHSTGQPYLVCWVVRRSVHCRRRRRISCITVQFTPNTQTTDNKHSVPHDRVLQTSQSKAFFLVAFTLPKHFFDVVLLLHPQNFGHRDVCCLFVGPTKLSMSNTKGCFFFGKEKRSNFINGFQKTTFVHYRPSIRSRSIHCHNWNMPCFVVVADENQHDGRPIVGSIPVGK
jgi:hypothetical protein